MASKNIQDILGWKQLTGMIRETKSGIPDPLPAGFRSLRKNVIGDASSYIKRTGQRRTARQTMYGTEARNTVLKEVGSRDVKLIHFFESTTLPMLTYQTLRQPESYERQDMAEQEVNEQVAQFAQRFDNSEIAACQMVLNGGLIYFDGDGNLLPSSSGAVLTIDFGIPANNLNQLNGNISASWATTSTNIPRDLRNIRKQAISDHGYPLKYAFYGMKIPDYINANTLIQPFLIRQREMNRQVLESNDIPQGLMDFTWIPVYESFWEDQDGTNRFVFGDDTIIFTPEPDRNWWEIQDGSYLVPMTFDIVGADAAAANAFKMEFGRFSYGQAIRNPVTAQIFNGNTFMPILKNPNVVYAADVTP